MQNDFENTLCEVKTSSARRPASPTAFAGEFPAGPESPVTSEVPAGPDAVALLGVALLCSWIMVYSLGLEFPVTLEIFASSGAVMLGVALPNLWFRVWGLGFEVWSSGSGVWGVSFGFRIEGLRSRI